MQITCGIKNVKMVIHCNTNLKFYFKYLILHIVPLDLAKIVPFGIQKFFIDGSLILILNKGTLIYYVYVTLIEGNYL